MCGNFDIYIRFVEGRPVQGVESGRDVLGLRPQDAAGVAVRGGEVQSAVEIGHRPLQGRVIGDHLLRMVTYLFVLRFGHGQLRITDFDLTGRLHDTRDLRIGGRAGNLALRERMEECGAGYDGGKSHSFIDKGLHLVFLLDDAAARYMPNFGTCWMLPIPNWPLLCSSGQMVRANGGRAANLKNQNRQNAEEAEGAADCSR